MTTFIDAITAVVCTAPYLIQGQVETVWTLLGELMWVCLYSYQLRKRNLEPVFTHRQDCLRSNFEVGIGDGHEEEDGDGVEECVAKGGDLEKFLPVA